MGLFNLNNGYKMNQTNFANHIKSLGYTVSNYIPSQQFEGLASCCSTNCNIIFYEFYNDNFAKDAYKAMKDRINDLCGMKQVNGTNKQKLTVKTLNNRYLIISRVENTMVCVDCDKKYEDMLNGILKQIGY